MQARHLHLGTAGWAIPRPISEHFPASGSGLRRYAAQFNAVEINSTFYRPHRASTYARWAATTPATFRFSVKVPRAITHDARLADSDAPLGIFLAEARRLGGKVGALLVQLPPSLNFDGAVAEPFFEALRKLEPTLTIACEPRHASWFAPEPDELLAAHRIARVAADPARHPSAGEPGGWRGLEYHRLHGSPRMYYSAYEPEFLHDLARRLAAAPAGSWCIFDNTTLGAAAANALNLKGCLGEDSIA